MTPPWGSPPVVEVPEMPNPNFHGLVPEGWEEVRDMSKSLMRLMPEAEQARREKERDARAALHPEESFGDGEASELGILLLGVAPR